MDKKVIINNDVVNGVILKDVQTTVQKIFENIINLNYFGAIADDITKNLDGELTNASFMTINLELSEEQKNALRNCVGNVVKHSVDTYVGGIEKDHRTKDVVFEIETSIKRIIEKVLCDIGQEINRGCIINSCAVKADAKNDNYNTIELRHSKESGDITVPTKGIFVSSNCVDLIVNSVKIEPENKGE